MGRLHRNFSDVFKNFWIAGGLLLSVYCSSLAAERPPDDAPLRQLLESHASEDTPGLAIAVLVDDRVAFEGTRGLANLESKAAIGPDTQFYLASLSKQFTSMAVALLEDRGVVKFDEALATVLSDLPAHLHGITLDQMLRHTAGFGDYLAGPFPPQSNEGVLEGVRRSKKLLFPPGTEHRYSNTGYNLLATCVQTASQKPYPDFMKKEIFAPLGMTNTQVCTSLKDLAGNRAVGYCTNAGTFTTCDYRLRTFGDGGIFSTLNDMKKWCRGLATYALLKPAKQEQLYTRTLLPNGKVVDYGRGWGVSETESGKCIQHSGSLAGFRSKVVWYPNLKLWIILLANRSDLDLSGLAQQIFKVHLAAASTMPNAPAKVSQPNRPQTNRTSSAVGSGR